MVVGGRVSAQDRIFVPSVAQTISLSILGTINIKLIVGFGRLCARETNICGSKFINRS